MNSDKVVKKPSSIHGYGIFAIEDIKKGEIIWFEDDNTKRISLEEYNNLEGKERAEWKTYGYYEGDGILGLTVDDSKYYNHSFNPNMVDNGINCVASRDIVKGEELVMNYMDFSIPGETIPVFLLS